MPNHPADLKTVGDERAQDGTTSMVVRVDTPTLVLHAKRHFLLMFVRPFPASVADLEQVAEVMCDVVGDAHGGLHFLTYVHEDSPAPGSAERAAITDVIRRTARESSAVCTIVPGSDIVASTKRTMLRVMWSLSGTKGGRVEPSAEDGASWMAAQPGSPVTEAEILAAIEAELARAA